MSNWQPIETAPKDGTVIFLKGGAGDMAQFTDNERHLALLRAPTSAYWSGDCWLYALAEACFVGCARENPTHWMPLPEPPK